MKALIKVWGNSSTTIPTIPDTDGGRKHSRTFIVVGSVLLGGSAFINGCFLSITIAALFLYSRRKKSERVDVQQTNMAGMNPVRFSFRDLEHATGGFKEEVGRGAFGIVYKGSLPTDPPIAIAVKKLENVKQEDGEKEFETEVRAVSQTYHRNLVQLLGYCHDDSQRLLVYEHMSNGSLASLLFGPSRPSWEERTKIAIGIARGLVYLHEECETQIIHCDIKPQNILLDDTLTARISDFGLAKLLKADQTRTRTGIRGTKGYVAPEWFKSMAITAKVDVYSYGVMLLEIVCSRKNLELVTEGDELEEGAILTDWAYDRFIQGRPDLLVSGDEEAMEDLWKLERFIKVGFWCIQEDPTMRPPMKKVLQMLEGAAAVPVPPDPSSFLSSLED